MTFISAPGQTVPSSFVAATAELASIADAGGVASLRRRVLPSNGPVPAGGRADLSAASQGL